MTRPLPETRSAPPDPAVAPAPDRRRIVGVDVARAFALIGMMSVHVLPLTAPGGGPSTVDVIASGRAAALFAVCAGVGIALATEGSRGLGGGRQYLGAAAGLVTRAALIGVLGMLLVDLSAPVAVILLYYALLFVVAIPLLRLPVPVLAALAVVWCVLAPALSHAVRGAASLPPGTGDQPGLDALAEPADLLITLLITGYYPVLPWITYLLAGLAIGRLDLRRVRTAAGLLVGGVGVTVGSWLLSAYLLGPLEGAQRLGVHPSLLDKTRFGTTPPDSWWWLAVPAAHSSTPIDLAHTTGTAIAVLGASLLLARALPPLAWVLGAIGSIPLTLYTAHVVALAIHPDDDLDLLVWHLVAATVLAVLIKLTGRRGPLEGVVGAASRAVSRLVA